VSMTTPRSTGALKEFIRAEGTRILGACTQCGRCAEVCPMVRYAAPKADDPKRLVGGILALLRGESGSPEALGWTAVCVRSGDCVPACPEHVNPTMMLRIARMSASGGLGGAKQLNLPQDRDFFDRVRAFAKLSLSEQEMRDWM